MKIAGKIFWGLSGVLIIIAGIYSLCNPYATLVNLALCIGIILIVSGTFNILTCAFSQGLILGAGWVLVEGFMTLLLGIFVVSYNQIVASALPTVFGMWIVFVGLSKVVHAFDYKKFGFSKWWIDLISGLILIVLGFLSFYKQIASAIAIAIVVGIFLIMQGISSLIDLFYSIKIEKKAIKIVKNVNNIAKSIIVEGYEEDVDNTNK